MRFFYKFFSRLDVALHQVACPSPVQTKNLAEGLPCAKTLRKPIEALTVSLNAQAKTILGPLDNDRAYFSQIHDQLDQRFAERLRL